MKITNFARRLAVHYKCHTAPSVPAGFKSLDSNAPGLSFTNQIAQIAFDICSSLSIGMGSVAWQAVVRFPNSSRPKSNEPCRVGYDRCCAGNLSLFFYWEQARPSRQGSRLPGKLSRESLNGGGAWTTIAYQMIRASAARIIGLG
ncbi:hypothetical protein PP1Y_AT22097 [Novosphingobium sp. PP1Y]|nr:hypothetical protein PP1Y_AT22097 [Novosphingobium sp. PP1Y]